MIKIRLRERCFTVTNDRCSVTILTKSQLIQVNQKRQSHIFKIKFTFQK